MKNLSFVAGLVILLGLMICSLFIGAGHVTFANLWSDPDMRDIFFISRVPRTLALVLAGSAMSVSGLIMQMLTQNRFVEPSIAGTTQSASLGLLLVMGFQSISLGDDQDASGHVIRDGWHRPVHDVIGTHENEICADGATDRHYVRGSF